ncbi:MAG: acetyl esterase [Planctomycetota bacterium]|jgi:acetyl esterase
MNKSGLDQEIIAFIDTYLRVSDGMSVDAGIAAMRDNYEQICRQFHHPRPDTITSFDSVVTGRHGNIPLRHYQYKGQTECPAQIVFIHGGGCVIGSLDSHDDICAELCHASGLNAISIDYRLSPEHFHPVHLDDVADAFETCWHPNSILVGISSGATLAAALSHRLKNNTHHPAGQVLIYPALGGDLLAADVSGNHPQITSYIDNADAPLLSTDEYLFYRGARCAGNTLPVTDPEFYPLVAKHFSGLPPTIAFSADRDPLRDDAQVYVDKILAAGGLAECFNETGLVHDYLRARHSSRRAGDSFRRICDAIVRLA